MISIRQDHRPPGQKVMNRNILVVSMVLASCTPTWLRADSPTFSGGVATIVYEKCAICHRPDSSGPFSLISYNDVFRRSATIKAVLEDKYMPPWKPIDHGLAFANNRSLTAMEEQTIKQWIDAGCPEGDSGKTPAPPKFPDGWSLGKPDMVVQMNGEFDVPADGPDIYRSFVFPLDLSDDKWVKAVELRPQAKSAVHHAIFYLDTNRAARKMDGADGKVGISGMGFLGSFGEQASKNESRQSVLAGVGTLLKRLRGGRQADADNAYSVNQQFNRGLGGYVPGTTPNFLPGDLAMALPKSSDIVMQTHFHPSGKPEKEKAELALYFADQPPSRPIVPIMVPPMFGFGSKLKVPAGEKHYRLFDSFTLPVDTQAIGVSGHAHYICREMKLTAKLPNGKSIVLLHIDDWDLDWQDRYMFKQPVDLPAGTVLTSQLIYDNSSDNPENPFDPPQEIRWGRGSNDEMGSVTLMAVATTQQDNARLQESLRQYFVESLVNRSSTDLIEMLMQLDNNRDGKLQPSEAPPRLDKRLFGFLDSNKDGALAAEELMPLMKLRDRFQVQGRNRLAPSQR